MTRFGKILPIRQKIKVIGHGSLAGVDINRFSQNRFSITEKIQLKASLNINPNSKILLFKDFGLH